MNKKALQVKNWDTHFENAESRKIKSVNFVCIPNKHDGKGYARIAREKRSCQVLTGWLLILQVASKMPQRGLLVDEDGVLDVCDLADMTRFPEEVFEIAIEVCTREKVGWLEWVEIPEQLVTSGRNPDKIPIHQDEIPVRPDASGRTEGNRREQNRRERKGKSTSKARGSLSQIQEYCQERELPQSDAEYLFNHWESNGWTNSGKPIKDWKATIRSWQSASYLPSQKNKNHTSQGDENYNLIGVNLI